MNIQELAKAVDPALLLGAMQQRALFLSVDGAPYAACPCEDKGWWVYKLELGSPEYFVDRALTRCSCPVEGECKHLRALKGTAVDTANVPWPNKRVQKRRKRPLRRGEN